MKTRLSVWSIGVGTAVLIGTLFGALPAASTAAAAARPRTIYAVATRAQFVDHADDRARGDAHNPFNADAKALATASDAKEKGHGPFPGDDVLYQFKLYAGPSLKTSIGSAEYDCVYNFAKQALCEASFELTGGSLFASGPVDFTASGFTLAVTGGSGSYLGARGQVVDAVALRPAAKNEHRLDFTF